MHNELKQFVSHYLSIVGGTFLVVSFVAFVTIPYTLGNASGGLKAAELMQTLSSAL